METGSYQQVVSTLQQKTVVGLELKRNVKYTKQEYMIVSINVLLCKQRSLLFIFKIFKWCFVAILKHYVAMDSSRRCSGPIAHPADNCKIISQTCKEANYLACLTQVHLSVLISQRAVACTYRCESQSVHRLISTQMRPAILSKEKY